MFLFFFLSFRVVSAEVGSFDQLFKEGVQLYQGQQYEEARKTFQKALSVSANNVSVLINLAHCEYKMGHRGTALAYLRKGLFWEPSSEEAQKFYKKITTELPVKQIPHRHSFFESLQVAFLAGVSVQSLFFVTFCLFIGLGWGLMSYYQKRKQFFARNQEGEELSRPPVFSWITGIMIFGFLLMVVVVSMKVIDMNTPKGTVIEEKLIAKTAPGEDESEVMTLFEGLEIEVLKESGDWVQVYYPGAYAGWVPKKSIMLSGI